MGQVLVLVIAPHSRDPPDVFREDHMDAPVCRTCGQKHWSRVCDVTPAVTKPVTPPVTVTKPVTQTINDLIIENAALSAEVAMLKRKLASRVAMTSAERVRKHRAKGKP
jgi:hypothetical protein